MSTLVFFLEEPSAKAMLEELLPNLLQSTDSDKIQYRLIHFQGKTDLERELPRKLRYWCEPHSFFIILRDKDSEDCHHIKKRIVSICTDSGQTNCIVRIACCELESWYLGDLQAVENGLGIKGLLERQSKKKYRNPDLLSNASDELRKITNYQYHKMSGSRQIGKYLDPKKNKSPSFLIFISAIQQAISVLQHSHDNSAT